MRLNSFLYYRGMGSSAIRKMTPLHLRGKIQWGVNFKVVKLSITTERIDFPNALKY